MSNQENKIEEKKEEAPKISNGEFWVKLWSLISESRKLIFVILIFTILSVTLDLIKPYIVKVVIDRLTNFRKEDLQFMAILIGLFFISDQARSWVSYLNNVRILKLLVNMEYYLGIRAQKKLMFLPLGYHEQENTGNKIVKIERGIQRINNLVENICWEVVPTIIQIIFSLIVLFWADYRLGLSLLIFAPLFLYLTMTANKKMRPYRKEMYKNYEEASGKMAQSIININAVQSFVQEKAELGNFDKIKKNIQKNEHFQWSRIMRSNLGRNVIVDFGNASVLLIGIYLVYRGEITVGTLIFAFTMSVNSYSSLFRLSRFYDRMEEGKEGVRRLMDLFSAKSDLVVKKNAFKPLDLKGNIEFKEVSFNYNNSTKPALDKISFKIEAGKMIALVGPSGSGKTTIARLIYRHYDVGAGQVLLDGKDLRDYDLYGFRKFLAIVPQEVEVFDVSVRENIAYAKPQATEAEIEEAAKAANAHEFITKLDKGYDTLVGERGIKLSGGQRQRLGIARALLANPKVLIFDEATSSLDSQSEFLIKEAMDRIAKNRTTIIIAHRLSTIKKADKIIVLENGQVVEEGNHLELAHIKSGLYYKLLKLQELGEIKE
jgi:ABC-type multidrug transport system fused ATPase/permease subunit